MRVKLDRKKAQKKSCRGWITRRKRNDERNWRRRLVLSRSGRYELLDECRARFRIMRVGINLNIVAQAVMNF